jgi:hypothetical protein
VPENRRFADAKRSNDWKARAVAGKPRFQFLCSQRAGSQSEHEFITATKIGPRRDIAVMAQFQRNAGIHVALGAGELPRGIAIIMGFKR